MKLEDLKTLITGIKADYDKRVITYLINSEFDDILLLLRNVDLHNFGKSHNEDSKTFVELVQGDKSILLTFKEDENVTLVNNPEKHYEVRLSLNDGSKDELIGTFSWGGVKRGHLPI